MIKADYTDLNDEEKKGIMKLEEEEEEYVIFLFADLVFVRVFLFLDVQLTLSDLVFVRVPLPRCSTDAFNYLFPFLFFRSRARRLNAGKPRLFEEDGKVIQFPTLIETNSFEIDTQAKVLGISTGMIAKAWKFFGYRKLSSCTTRFLHSGEHGFDEDIMKQLGFKKEDHVTVLVWYALLDDKTKKEVNNDAARNKRNREKAKLISVENEKGEKMTKAQLRNQLYHKKRKQEMVDIGEGRMVTKAQFQYAKDKKIIVENEEGEKMTKAQLRNQLNYKKRKPKQKQRNKEFIRKQFICRPPGCLEKEKCSICGREKSFGWAKAPDALWYVEKLFKEKGLTEYPSFRAANGYLTMKKRKYLGKEDILLRTTDILCYACWKTCEGAAEKTMQKLLKL